MSLIFNAVNTDFKGIVQIYEKEIGANRGDISGDTNKLKELAADVNLAWDDYVHLALSSSGKWQFDDSNQTDYPIIITNLVDGQRDYPFTIDGSSNLVLDIYRVFILPSATSTMYQEIVPVDQQSDIDTEGFTNGQNAEGVPYHYDKTANSIFLDPIPSYNATSGLKVYINREPSYFTSGDTTKKPGCPGIHHRYFALKPALDYARRKSLANYNLIREEVVGFEGDEEKGVTGSIERYFSRREKDERPVFQPEPVIYE